MPVFANAVALQVHKPACACPDFLPALRVPPGASSAGRLLDSGWERMFRLMHGGEHGKADP